MNNSELLTDSPVAVNLNLDLNKIMDDVFAAAKKVNQHNDLMVITKNGTLRDATVEFTLKDGGSGRLASVKGSQDVSPVDTRLQKVDAAYCAVGVHAVGNGSNIYMRIKIAGRYLQMICSAQPAKSNYIQYCVTHQPHTYAAQRKTIENKPKHYGDDGSAQIKIGDCTVWVTLTTAESPYICQIELREHTDAITYLS